MKSELLQPLTRRAARRPAPQMVRHAETAPDPRRRETLAPGVWSNHLYVRGSQRHPSFVSQMILSPVAATPIFSRVAVRQYSPGL